MRWIWLTECFVALVILLHSPRMLLVVNTKVLLANLLMYECRCDRFDGWTKVASNSQSKDF